MWETRVDPDQMAFLSVDPDQMASSDLASSDLDLQIFKKKDNPGSQWLR